MVNNYTFMYLDLDCTVKIVNEKLKTERNLDPLPIYDTLIHSFMT